MSEIEFDIDKENKHLKQLSPRENPNSGLVQFLIKKGIVKDEKQANIFIVVILVAMVALSIFIFYYFSGTGWKGNLTAQESNFFNSGGDKKTPAQYDATLFSQ